jgi:F-type H+-transporting ATPase subunit b
VTFKVDPQLIAGAELHFPTAILRFSWQSALAAARAEIGAHASAR